VSHTTPLLETHHGSHIGKTLVILRKRRTQDLHRGSGQRRQDDDPVPVPDERGRPDLAHHRLQRRGGHVEERPVHHVGPRGSRLAQGSLEHVLLKHRVCDPGGGLDRPRATVHHQGGAPQDDGPRRTEPSQHLGVCQQARRQRLHERRRDLQTTQPAVHAETQVADTGMLRPHRGRVVPGPRVDREQHQEHSVMCGDTHGQTNSFLKSTMKNKKNLW